MCDGQVEMQSEQCGCVAVENRHIPVLEATIKNETSNGCDNEFESVTLQSRAPIFFIFFNTLNLDLRSELNDELLFEEAVLEQVESIKNGVVRNAG